MAKIERMMMHRKTLRSMIARRKARIAALQEQIKELQKTVAEITLEIDNERIGTQVEHAANATDVTKGST